MHANGGLGYENFTEVVIPSMITYEDKTYHVTRIGHGTFWLCDKLTYVDIPNTIKSIGIAAFRSCRTLTSITLNEGLESIEHHAFYDCVRLKEVTLPSTLKTMGQGIFYFSSPSAGSVLFPYFSVFQFKCSRPSVSSGKWFQEFLWIPKSMDAQVSYMKRHSATNTVSPPRPGL